jgi:hypothetical protein
VPFSNVVTFEASCGCDWIFVAIGFVVVVDVEPLPVDVLPVVVEVVEGFDDPEECGVVGACEPD